MAVSPSRRHSVPLLERDEGAFGSAGVELSGPADTLTRILEHPVPLGDPADSARQGKKCREPGCRAAAGLEDDARVDVDIRKELLYVEVFVLQVDPRELHGQPEVRLVTQTDCVLYLMSRLLHYLGPWIIVLVDPVTKTHQPEGIVLVLGPRDELGNAVLGADLLQHPQHRLVGASVGRAPEGRDAGGNTGEGIRTGGAGEPYRGG